MNNLDVAGLLSTYSLKTSQTRSKEKLQELVRELKKELNSDEIKKLTIAK